MRTRKNTFTLFIFAMLSAPAFAGYSIPTVSRAEILKYGDTAVGTKYVWGGTQWNPDDKSELGADCSGFVQKSWMYPKRMSPQSKVKSGRVTTVELKQAQDGGFPWTRLDTTNYALAERGDAFVYRSNGHGHTFLQAEKKVSGIVSLEARGKKYKTGYVSRSYAKMKATGYRIIKRKNLALSSAPLN